MRYIAPLLADFANGIFAVLITAHVLNVQILWWHFLIGIVFAMLPDLDAIPELLRRGRIAASSEYVHDHRDYLHFPILFLLIGILVYVIFPFWGLLFLIATMLHFLNDMYGTGWGVPIFWPLSKDRYKFFCSEQNELSFRAQNFFRHIPHQNLQQEIVTHGYDDWVDRLYLHPSLISVIEYSLFGTALILLIVSLI